MYLGSSRISCTMESNKSTSAAMLSSSSRTEPSSRLVRTQEICSGWTLTSPSQRPRMLPKFARTPSKIDMTSLDTWTTHQFVNCIIPELSKPPDWSDQHLVVRAFEESSRAAHSAPVQILFGLKRQKGWFTSISVGLCPPMAATHSCTSSHSLTTFQVSFPSTQFKAYFNVSATSSVAFKCCRRLWSWRFFSKTGYFAAPGVFIIVTICDVLKASSIWLIGKWTDNDLIWECTRVSLTLKQICGQFGRTHLSPNTLSARQQN